MKQNESELGNQDRRGLAVTAEHAAAVDAYEAAFSSFLNYEQAAGGLVKSVLADHPEMPMALILRGYMTLMIESSAVQARVQSLANDLVERQIDLTERERLHARALQQWSSADPAGAARTWDRLLADHPRDLLALKMHHYTTFWRGRASTLRSTVESVLPFWDEAAPGYDHVLGMHAFALNETGRFEMAEAVGREAVERNSEDLWSVHAVAHALEMQGDIERGVAWFDDKLGTWESKNPFQGHLWWHAALFPYAAGNYDEVLRLYDQFLVPLSSEFFLDIQNRASILSRLELANVDVGDRWGELADFSRSRLGDHVLPFTDLHCCLALAGSDSASELAQFVESMNAHRQHLDALGFESVGYQTATELAYGIEQWAQGDATGAADHVLPLLDDLAPIGGSRAQQSLFEQIIVQIAVADSPNLGRSLLASRYGTTSRHVPTIDSLVKVLSEHDLGSGDISGLIASLKAHRAEIGQIRSSYDAV